MGELNWAEKYRPRLFSEVVGQERAVKLLTGLVGPPKRFQNIILEGPSGSGKSTLARVFAQAVQCKKPEPNADPCRVCDACRLFENDGQINFYLLRGKLDTSVDDIRELDEDLAFRPMFADAHVVFVDEAHKLTEDAQTALLTLLEKNPRFAVFIFSLIEGDALLPALRNRCLRIELAAPRPSEAHAFLRRISASEGLDVENGALEVVAGFENSFRGLATSLQRLAILAGDQPIDVARASEDIWRDRLVNVVEYLKAVVDADLETQLSALKDTSQSPRKTARGVLELLSWLKVRHIGPSMFKPRTHRLDLLVPDSDAKTIVEGLSRRAELLGIGLAALIDEVLEFWTYLPLVIDEAVLEAQVIRFNDILTIGQAFPDDPSERARRRNVAEAENAFRSGRARRRSPRWRTSDRAARGDPADYLSEDQARDLYEAATFLIQRHGVTFNAFLTLDHAALGIETEDEAVQLVSDLTRELRLRLQDWAASAAEPDKAELHRIVLLERPSAAGLSSAMVMHLPGFAEKKARRWIFEKFLPAQVGKTADIDPQWLEVRHIADARGAQAYHWELMRRIWRGADPEAVVDGQHLPDLLKVPNAARRPGGSITRRRFNISHGIGQSAQQREALELGAHYSAWSDRVWDWLFRYWELRDFGMRDRARIRRAERERAWRVERELTGDPLAARKLASEMGVAGDDPQKPEEFRQKPWLRSGPFSS